nr:LemA family protein [uncultured Desulfuromonas sp.]
MFRRLLMLLITLPLLSSCGYNQIQSNEEAVFSAWGDVEATYQRRADLIPNLVETVKAYASHEKETLQSVTEARATVGKTTLTSSDLGNAAQMEQFTQAQQQMSGALSRLLVVAERYPDLKASQNFRDLQHQLEGTENRINVARQRYNDAVQRFNTSIRTFPGNITNNLLLKLERKEPFKAAAGSEVAPQVKF